MMYDCQICGSETDSGAIMSVEPVGRLDDLEPREDLVCVECLRMCYQIGGSEDEIPDDLDDVRDEVREALG